MTDYAPQSRASVFRLLIIERLLHGICMGAAALLPAFLLTNGLDEVYFGTLSAISAFVAIFIILMLPLLIKFAPVERIAVFSSLFFSAGYIALFLASLVPTLLQPATLLGFPLISAGWVAHFTLGSIRVSSISIDGSRQKNFMVYAAFSTLGISLGPILGKALLSTTSSYPSLFMFLIGLSGIGFLVANVSRSCVSAEQSEKIDSTPVRQSTRPSGSISPAMFFVFMVFLQSAIFTVLINFQVVFSEQIGVSTSIFFICWAVGIMAPRLLLGGWMAKKDNRFVLPILTSCLAIGLWLLAAQPDTNFCYGLTAIGLGVFYGLSYPIVQAETVKFAPEKDRGFYLIAFSLAYFLAFYTTPLAAGFVVKFFSYSTVFLLAGWLAVGMAALQAMFYFGRPNLRSRR